MMYSECECLPDLPDGRTGHRCDRCLYTDNIDDIVEDLRWFYADLEYELNDEHVSTITDTIALLTSLKEAI